MCPNAADIVIISDDEEIDETPPRPTGIVINNNVDGPELEKLEASNVKNAADKSTKSTNAYRPIHLPKLPEVKEELLSQATKQIENIFGEPDEELLESVFQINPYVFKQLNNNNIVISGEKLHDGDELELLDEVKLPKLENNVENPDMPPPQLPVKSDKISEDDLVIVDDNEDDYDENFELSQAMLREMKDEMADAPQDLSDEEHFSQQEKEDFEPAATWIKKEIATKLDDDEIILIEDEDDELYSKVADWSSKLLTQNIMSQVYPLDEEDELNDANTVEEQALQLFNDTNLESDTDNNISDLPILMKRRSHALRIESSEDDSPGKYRLYTLLQNSEPIFFQPITIHHKNQRYANVTCV